MRLHEVIRDRLEASGRSLRSLAAESRLDPGNLSRYCNTGRGIGSEKVDRLLEVLDVELAPSRYPPELAWLEDADHWLALVRAQCPDVDAAELRQIVVSIVRPMEQRRFLLRRVGDGYAL